MNPTPIITLDDITVRLRDRWFLHDTTWQIRTGEHWVVLGPNGAGKSTLANVLMGRVPVIKGKVRRHYVDDADLCRERRVLAMASSEQYHYLYGQERLLGDMDHFSGRLSHGTTAGGLLERARVKASESSFCRLAALFNLKPLLPKPITALSSGEMRKLLLARALLGRPCLLILDEPFNGLDATARERLVHHLETQVSIETRIILIVHRAAEIPGFCTHVLQLADGRIVWQGERALFSMPQAVKPSQHPQPRHIKPMLDTNRQSCQAPLIQMQGVKVRFGRQIALDGVDWTVRPGEHWALTGPNGSGKSTLLKLITGDELQAYANKIILFGRPRGTGETVWQIKQQIGYLGDELQARYQRFMSVLDVVASGFFDSVGLYRQCTDEQRRTGRQWLNTLGLDDLADRTMSQLSFGQQRLILIVRAMVKSPPLLILDEPCNGLDRLHRLQVLRLLDRIGPGGETSLIFVSHLPDEIPACITHRLCLENGKVVAS